ncbi:embryonic polyadenylate-binding protein 2 isoform X2 [Neophocaena asiaeorientalis asiaeorientalis]|uniref:Embryonic polyadenylate-binding protein 2 isoform X2 n=1 Tax=Neophocaena asiaeorientalis asiaeorientalis TaxID=1706337 RepID=A0A341APQ4_NEOAA|nr:embryonic polyadenylate-binding protein 2 isoform X2 [Neophocaena asiaeorientalis asiaeorientalis]
MWPFLSRALFPPPTEAWLRRASSDPEAQGWGAWSQAEKSPLGPGAGDTEEEETGEAEEREEDAGFLLSVLERGDLAECPLADQELEAIRLKLWAMEQAQQPEPPGEQGPEGEEEDAGALLAGQLLSPETAPLSTDSPTEAVEADHRSVYVGNVDYGGTAQELEAYFNHCGEIQRVTILCDKFSGHPKGCCPKEPIYQGSAPRTAGAFGDTQAPGGDPSPTATSRAGPVSDHGGGTGGAEDSRRGIHRIEGRARF